MKPLLLLLGLSLAANAALFLTRPGSPQSNASTTASNQSSSSATAGTAVSASSGKSASTAPGPFASFWEKLRAGDASVVASLRAAGWPEDAIRALVIAQINDQFRARGKALRPDYSTVEYWKPNAYGTLWTPELMKAQRALGREKKAAIKALLGDDYTPDDITETLASRYDGLPITAAQSEAMDMIEEDYRILTSEIRGPSAMIGNNVMLAEDREKLAYLEKEKAADLAKALSPELALEWELRNSNVASNLRYNLRAFEPTEQEFRQLYEVQKHANETAGYVPGAPGNAYSRAQTEADAEAKKNLSPERYADYTLAKDYDYSQLYQLTQRLQLPKEKAVAANALKADFEKRSREIPNKPGTEGRQATEEARAALASEAAAQLTQILGQRGYDAFKSTGPGNWVSRLNPQPQSR